MTLEESFLDQVAEDIIADLNFTRPEPSTKWSDEWLQWAAGRYDVPVPTLGAIQRYVKNRLQPGGFLSAVLRHDLFEATFQADEQNLQSLTDIVLLIHNHAPAESHGSSERIRYWLEG